MLPPEAPGRTLGNVATPPLSTAPDSRLSDLYRSLGQACQRSHSLRMHANDDEKDNTGQVLRKVPRPRHAARQGAQGRREKATEGDLRDHEGQGPVRRVGAPRHKIGYSARRGLRELALIPRPIEELGGVDETIGTPPTRTLNGPNNRQCPMGATNLQG